MAYTICHIAAELLSFDELKFKHNQKFSENHINDAHEEKCYVNGQLVPGTLTGCTEKKSRSLLVIGTEVINLDFLQK